MSVQEQIKEYITNQPEPKRSDMQELHQLTLYTWSGNTIWGKAENEKGEAMK